MDGIFKKTVFSCDFSFGRCSAGGGSHRQSELIYTYENWVIKLCCSQSSGPDPSSIPGLSF